MGGVPVDDRVDDSTIDPLPEDNQTPFSPADNSAADPVVDDQLEETTNSTHPATDTNIQPEEVYESGLDDAAGLSN